MCVIIPAYQYYFKSSEDKFVFLTKGDRRGIETTHQISLIYFFGVICISSINAFPFPDNNCLLLFLGFDHCHPEVYEHCKRLLLHLLIVMGSNSNIRTVASVLLRNKEFNEPRVLTVKQTAHLDYTFTGICFKSGLKIQPYFVNLALEKVN